MNDDPSNLAAAMVAARFASDDEARSAWLEKRLAEEPEHGDRVCSHGHPKRERGGGKWYCPTCNAARERGRRARARRAA